MLWNSRLSGLIGLVLPLLLLGCGSGGSDNGGGAAPAQVSTPQKLFSISASPRLEPLPATDAEYVNRYLEAFELAVSAGANSQVSTYTWRDLEPTAGIYNLSGMSDSINFASQHGMKLFLGIQLINTVKREMPADLADKELNDPEVIARFNLLLDKVYPLIAKKVSYLSIGNEVDVYLQAHPAEWQTYKAFYQPVLQHAHALDSEIKVGVTATAGGLLSSATQEMMELNSLSDVLIATYYPLSADYKMLPPNQIDADFPALINLANGKPLIFQEIGYAASVTIDSSEQAQAEFVQHVFANWRDDDGKVAMLNLFCLHDFSAQQTQQLQQYYGLQNANFYAYLATLGLRRSDGTARLAWQSLLDEKVAEMLKSE